MAAQSSTDLSITDDDKTDAGDDDEQPGVVVALCWAKAGAGSGTLGVAVYDEDRKTIEVGECRETDSFLTVHKLKVDLRPEAFLIPGGSDQRFIAAVKEPLNGSRRPPTVRLGDASGFTADAAVAKLSAATGMAPGECRQYLSRSIDTAQSQLLRALGGCLEGAAGPVKGVVHRSFSAGLAVDPATLDALHVFKRLSHPSADTGIGSSKEGLSLYGLLNMCKTRIGSSTLRSWLASPTRDIDVINARLDAIDVLTAPHNDESLSQLRNHLRFICDPTDLLKKFGACKQNVKTWQSFYQLLFSYPVVVGICKKLSEFKRCRIFSEVVEKYDEVTITELFQKVHETIDFPESQEQGRVAIRRKADEALDSHKEAYAHLPRFLEKVAEAVVTDLKNFQFPVRVQYFPLLGYFTMVAKAYYVDALTTHLPNADYTFQFQSEEWLYYKNPRMLELDEKYGDFQSAIFDAEDRIQGHLAECVGKEDVRKALLAILPVFDVDCVASLALVSKTERWIRPTVVGSGGASVLRIIDGRHPLQEKTVDRFVPNDTILEEETRRTHIVTGPNSCGKSVLLKQVGMITLMAHVGCYVPAREAVIGVCDRIMTRMRSSSSPSAEPSSAFSSDLGHIKDMISYSTRDSLLIVDEFGKGTVAADGIALLAGAVQHFLNKGKDSPRLMLCTHFVEILGPGQLDGGNPLVHVCHMTVDREATDARKLQYRFKLRPGLSDGSFATYCASAAGIPRAVVRRAEYVLLLLQKRLPKAAFLRLVRAASLAERRHKKVLRTLHDADTETCDVTALRKAICAAAAEWRAPQRAPSRQLVAKNDA
ncbi:DNA mismatch repair protein MSH5 [Diplonema papillatum]|nr:DNA mismatch repair protein MSH5 [Diplonema papillatum]